MRFTRFPIATVTFSWITMFEALLVTSLALSVTVLVRLEMPCCAFSPMV
jgi:hypothetical protein